MGGRSAIYDYRERSATREPAHPISARYRRVLANRVRGTTAHTPPAHPRARRRVTLLLYRVAPVRTELLETGPTAAPDANGLQLPFRSHNNRRGADANYPIEN